ncbi:FHA domain-containing protein [Streptomyces sp. NPDC096012]|uniref:FHA domain-containing protein n=1 Tax=Streptomyces sp. NPDC096012 TaxID=3155684 RepID=UPI00336A8D56
MQIRLTVVDPLGPPAGRGRAASRDVLVTAPTGTDLAAVASALAGAVAGEGGAGRDTGGSPVVLYAGTDRLDPRRCTLGEPPLVDGAVLSLGAPAAAEPHPELDDAPTQLHVVAGPDAGGVHLLHGGRITVGRSAEADVPLDDPDVSRLHCAVTVAADGRVGVADLDSTNGTVLDGTRVADRPVPFPAGALLRIGESALRVTPSGGPGARVRTVADGEGCVRVSLAGGTPGAGAPAGTAGADTPAGAPAGSGADTGPRRDPAAHARVRPAAPLGAHGSSGSAHPVHDRDTSAGGRGIRPGDPLGQPVVPGQAAPPSIEQRGGGRGAGGAASGNRDRGRRVSGAASDGDTHAGRLGIGGPGRSPGDPYEGRSAHTRADGEVFRAQDGRAGDGAYPAQGGGTDGDAYPAGAYPTRDAQADRGAYPAHDTQADRGTYTAQPAQDHGGAYPAHVTQADGREGRPLAGDGGPQGARRRGLGAWARRLAGGRGEQPPGREAYDDAAVRTAEAPASRSPQQPETWPDPAALLLTALGPGPRLWERGPGHPEALTVRLGTADRSAPGGAGLLPAVPVTAALREAGALGLAGPRPRLSGLARAVLAQLAALHSPDLLEIVLISADRARPVEERTAEWSWLGWLPHVRPAHGQACRLLLAYDREQAAARTQELLRRIDDHATAGRSAARPAPADRIPGPSTAPDATGGSATPPGVPVPGTTAGTTPGHTPGTTPGHTADTTAGHTPGTPAGHTPGTPAGHTPGTPVGHTPGVAHGDAGSATGAVPGRRPSWARDDAGSVGGGFAGPFTVVVVDGDPGGAALQEAVARLAVAGPRAGIHVVCLAETEPASAASPVARTYEAACEVTPTFRHCGAVALLSGDVAAAVHLLRVAPSGPVGPGTAAAVDAVSAAWAERFARALAPLRPDGPVGERHARVATPLPRSARLLDELGLARATPASLMARWADAADDAEALGGRARAVLGAGPRGPLTADLVADGPHLLIEGPAGSGRTELLRAVVASLAAAERPDRLGVVLIDGRDGVGTATAGDEGLRVCTEIPHVTTHLAANDPVRMREFAQSLSAELKRRAELLGRSDFAAWHAGHGVSGRIVAQRTAATGDIETPPSSTLRLRPGGAARRRAEAAPPLPRLVVVVDDLDALVSPPLGSPGRPAAGSVLRALEAVAREGERLGVHLVAAAGAGGRTAQTEPARRAALRVTLATPEPGPEEPAPGRGRLACADGRITDFQAGRVTGRIPRTATQRPTVVPLEWQRMGDPPARRPVRELGNGPTDLALLASAVERAAREVSAAEVPSLL